MVYVVSALFFLALLVLPAMWARWVLRRYGAERADFPGTGGEFARHLLNRFGLGDVVVETTPQGDHYDPAARAVRLLPDHFDGRSLTAVTVAAHEVGHALQHHSGYAPLALRSRLVTFARGAERVGAGFMMLAPVLLAVTRMPHSGGIMLAAGLLSFGMAALVHLVTLPVELDASYRRALPVLASGYVPKEDLPAARHILTACAFTYVATSLLAMVNLGRWLAVLRR